LGDVVFLSNKTLDAVKQRCWYSLTGINANFNKLQIFMLKWNDDTATKFYLQFKYVKHEWKFMMCELIHCPEGGKETRQKAE
jgi:hypothetical protein